MAEKRPRTERSAREMDTDAGGEASTATEYQSKVKKEHMTNIYLTYSDKEVIVDFVQDHEELYDKTNEHFKDKARKDCLWERFASVVSQPSSVNHKVFNQFAQMKTILTSFLSPRQESTRRAFFNYLASELENFEERKFQTFRNEAVKLLSGIQSRAEERTVNPINIHLLVAPVPLLHLWHLLFSSSCSLSQGIHLDYFRNPDASKSGQTTI